MFFLFLLLSEEGLGVVINLGYTPSAYRPLPLGRGERNTEHLKYDKIYHMKINFHMNVNFPFAATVIALVGLIFTGYIYMTAASVVAQVENRGITSTSQE